jgi:hypothetical protein
MLNKNCTCQILLHSETMPMHATVILICCELFLTCYVYNNEMDTLFILRLLK